MGNTFRTGYRLQIDWTATQSIANNTSTVTAKMYLVSLGSSYTINSSSTKDGNIIINGTSHTFSGAGLADLNGNQKKLISTQTQTITHNTDGTKTFTLDGWFDIEVTLGGTFYDTVELTATTFTLDTIPRKSTLTSSPSWTAGNNLAVSISRADSSFTHTVNIKVNGVTIKTLTGIGASTTATFALDENTSIFNQLNTGASIGSTIEVITFSGTTNIGTNTYTGTVTAPSASTLSGWTAGKYIDQQIDFNLSRANSNFTHTLVVTCGTFTKTLSGVGASISWTPDTTEQTSLYNQTPNSNEVDGNIKITTFFNGEQVRTPVDIDIDFLVRNSNPTFSASSIVYDDTNTTTTTLTGNNQYIIQNQSTLRASVTTSATAVNGATLSKYVVTIDGKQGEITTATGEVSIGEISAGTNQTLTITAVDSRGNQTSVTKTVTVVPYVAPKLTISLQRTNKFDNNTTLKVKGTFSPLIIDGVPKNTIDSGNLEYQYKEKGAGSFGTSQSLTFTITGDTFTATDVVINLDNTKSWDFQVSVTDKVDTFTAPASVGEGIPIFFIDTVKKSIGVNKFPDAGWDLDVKGLVKIGSQLQLVSTNSAQTKSNIYTDSTEGRHVLQLRGASSFTDGASLNLYANDDSFFGGELRVITDNVLRLQVEKTGKTILILGGETLDLKAGNSADNVFMAFYADSQSQSTRSGWFGYNVAGSTKMSVTNEMTNGNIDLVTNGIGKVTVNGKDAVAIDSTGTNANGTYIRYVDGTQICWVRMNVTDQAINTAYGSLFQGVRTWTYPATFIDVPAVSCGEFKWGTGSSWGASAGADATTASLRGIDAVSRASGTAVSISAIAIGRWK
jgi:hypothetical protein